MSTPSADVPRPQPPQPQPAPQPQPVPQPPPQQPQIPPPPSPPAVQNSGRTPNPAAPQNAPVATPAAASAPANPRAGPPPLVAQIAVPAVAVTAAAAASTAPAGAGVGSRPQSTECEARTGPAILTIENLSNDSGAWGFPSQNLFPMSSHTLFCLHKLTTNRCAYSFLCCGTAWPLCHSQWTTSHACPYSRCQ